MFNECLEIRIKSARFCILNSSFKIYFIWEVISSIRHSVSSTDETPRSSSKVLRDRRIFNSLLGVLSGDERVRLNLDILHTKIWKCMLNSILNVKFIKMRNFTVFIAAVCVLFLIKLQWTKNKSLKLNIERVRSPERFLLVLKKKKIYKYLCPISR